MESALVEYSVCLADVGIVVPFSERTYIWGEIVQGTAKIHQGTLGIDGVEGYQYLWIGSALVEYSVCLADVSTGETFESLEDVSALIVLDFLVEMGGLLLRGGAWRSLGSHLCVYAAEKPACSVCFRRSTAFV